MQITVLSSESSFIAALAVNREPVPPEAGEMSWQVGTPQLIPGAAGGWWELAVDIGVIAAPVSIVCNLLANWIWSALTATQLAPPLSVGSQNPPTTDIRLVLREGDKVAELSITGADIDAIRASLQAALVHVHSES